MRASRPALQRIAVLAEAVSTPAIAFVMIPFLVATVGRTGLGQFVFVQAIAATMAVVGMGLSLSAINAVARHGVEGGSRQPGGALAALVVAGVAAALLALVSITGLPDWVASWGGVPAEIVRPGIVWAALQLPAPVLLSFLKGRGRFVEAALVELSAKAFVYGVFVVLLTHDGPSPLAGAVKGVAFAEALALGFRVLAAGRLAGGGILRLPQGLEHYNALLRFSGGVWLQAGSSLVFNTLDKFIVGAIAGPAVLGAYAATATIASLIHFVPATVASVHVPRIAAAHAAGDNCGAIRARLAREVRILGLLLCACVVAVLWVGQHISVWPMLELPEQAGPLVAIVLAYAVLWLSIVDYSMLLGASRTRAIGSVNLVASLVASVLLVAGTLTASVLWVAAGRAFYAVVCTTGLRLRARSVGLDTVRA
jgi:O-antigen/teichoic acid export membrane protein